MPLTWINAYLCSHVLLVVAWLVVAGAERLRRGELGLLRSRDLVLFGYALLAASLLLPVIGATTKVNGFATPVVQIWSGAPSAASRLSRAPWIAATPAPHATAVALPAAGSIALVALLLGIAIFVSRIIVDLATTRRIVRAAHVMHSLGSVRVLVSDTLSVPFSCWYPNRRLIVVPSLLLLRPHDLAMVIRHEIQHHRQGDTKALYLLQCLRALFFWNPAIHGLVKKTIEWQEFACDEASVRRGSPAAYCDCLFEAAQRAVGNRALLHTPMIDNNRSMLRRRIEAVLAMPRRKLSGAAMAAIVASAIGALAAISVVLAAPVQDRRVTWQMAEEMAATLHGSNFPIGVNEHVLAQLNAYMGSPEDRASLRDALSRMEEYRSTIKAQLELNLLPIELAAIPLVESGYRNRSADGDPRHGAGIWMFIKPTAIHYGLEVTPARDDRLDVKAETDAAMRMLSDLHARFGDWELALLAYNAGVRRVERGIEATGTRDAWRLIEQGYQNDPDYLAKVVAAMIVLGNPQFH